MFAVHFILLSLLPNLSQELLTFTSNERGQALSATYTQSLRQRSPHLLRGETMAPNLLHCP